MKLPKYRQQVMFEPHSEDEAERGMLCPGCGGCNLHFHKMEEHPDPELSFWCENCGDDEYHKLLLRFHKGTTYMSWELGDVAYATIRVKE